MHTVKINRRHFIGAGAAAFGLASMTSLSHAASGGDAVEAATRYGKVSGKIEDGIAKFLGVPYAAPPLGDLRFRPPEPPKAWSGTLETTSFANPSFQAPGAEMGPKGNGRMPAPSEDCLYLNVWTPAADNKRRPVMFYNHGGGYMIGSGAATGQDGSKLAQLNDVVVVQSNHRLGLLGYLFLGDLPGGDRFAANQGMLDILAALQWTHDNIENFGGDPDNIMVWGESGGGAKTGCIYAMPDAADLFHKASIESAAPLRLATRDGASERARKTLSLLGLKQGDIGKLVDMPAEKLLEAQQADMPNGEAPWAESPPIPGFGAFVDGKIIPKNPFADGVADFSKDKPLMIGTCRDEMVFFSLFGDKSEFNLPDIAALRARLAGRIPADLVDGAIDAFGKSRPDATPSELYFAITTSTIVRDAVRIAEKKVNQGGAPVFMYQLAYDGPTKVPGTDYPLGSPHASDISMKFDTPETGQDFVLGVDQTPARYQTAKNMSGLWASFARNGHPGIDKVPAWPAYDLEKRVTMWIDAECRIVEDPDPLERQFWAEQSV